MATIAVVQLDTRKTGKGISKSARLEKKIPAVIYGPKMKNVNALVDELFVLRHSGAKHESSIFDTKSDSEELSSLKVMFKNIQNHPGTGRPIHVDLYALDMSATIRVNVSIKFEGEPKGVKEEGALIQTLLREIEIETNPIDIPEFISVDISGLEVGDSIHVSDVNFASNIKPMTSLERTILTLTLPREEKEEEDTATTDAGAETDHVEAAPATESKE